MSAAADPALYTDLLIDKPEVARRCFLSTRTIERMIVAGEFPPPLRIGRSRVAWRTSEVESWLAARPRVQPRQ